MSRYWVIAPFENGELFEKVWAFDLDNRVISIGWSDLGDISSYPNKDSLRSAYEKQRYTTNPGNITRTVNMLWNFYHEIKEGDIVLARQGTKRLAAVGEVKSKAYYDENKGSGIASNNPEYDHRNFLDVEWYDNPRNKKYNGRVAFGIQTIYEIDETEYEALVSDTITDVEELEEGIENRPQFFLEKYLEQFIIDNFDNIFDKEIILLKDNQDNIVGRQYRTDVGIIDILAREPDTNSFVVIELKKGRESDKVIGQILRYMGWVGEELCQSDQTVKGIIICQESDDKLYYATKATQNIKLKYYRIDFKLFDAPIGIQNKQGAVQ